MLELSVNSSVEWKPSPVVALATSVDDFCVAAAREDGSVEIWLVSPGSIVWHCQMTIHGAKNSRASSLVWCRTGSRGLPYGRLFSSGIDGSVSEWDLFDLKQKVVLDSIGVSIWQMAVVPQKSSLPHAKQEPQCHVNGHADRKFRDDDDSDISDIDDDVDSVGLHEQPIPDESTVALACDDGCVRFYSFADLEKFTYVKSFARVSGRALSVTWSCDASMVFSGSSDGFIRCWDFKLAREVYRITAGLGGLGSGPELCIWSLLTLRCGTLVSADSTGSVQFWDSQHGTLLQAHSFHKGDVNALAAAPSHDKVFSAGTDGQVILYKLSTETAAAGDDRSSSAGVKKWVYVGYHRAHSHDVRALAVTVPINSEDLLPDRKEKRFQSRFKRIEFSYHKWANLEVPMLISAGDDTKLFAYSAKEFTKFHPHDICPAPQRVPIQLALNSVFDQSPLLLVQNSSWLDIICIRVKGAGVFDETFAPGSLGSLATTDLVARVKSKASRKIISSTMSTSGSLFAFSDHVKPSLFELKRCGGVKSAWTVCKRQLPSKLPLVHSMVFSSDSSRLMLAGHDRRIYVVDVESSKLIHTFTPRHKECNNKILPSEPPMTKMFSSSDGRWLAAINCFGDVYVFNLKTQRQHWFISRMDGAFVTAGGFTPQEKSLFIISTSLNQVYAFDVKAKQLVQWFEQNTFALPKRFQEIPGEVIGLSFPPSNYSNSLSTVVVYSARAMCTINFRKLGCDDGKGLANGYDSARKMIQKSPTDGLDCDDDKDLAKGHDSAPKMVQKSPINGKRKLIGLELDNIHTDKINFEVSSFREVSLFRDPPVLFVGHLSEKCVCIVNKPWMQVVKTLDAPPVHRHIYGT